MKWECRYCKSYCKDRFFEFCLITGKDVGPANCGPDKVLNPDIKKINYDIGEAEGTIEYLKGLLNTEKER